MLRNAGMSWSIIRAARRARLAVAVATIAMLLAVLPPHGSAKAAGGLADLPALMPVIDCAAVATLDLSGVTDGAVTIQSATVVSADVPAPYCEVKGTIAPANMFEIRLPTQGWTQRYLQTGCGGLCGQVSINYTQAATCPPIAGGSIASATTDMGHQGKPDGSWADGNPQAQIDFAYRGVHSTAQVAKAVIAKFYGQPPVYSYFSGCSDGGREALMEAQRYPNDFDGIAAGAPANDMAVQNTVHHAWNVLANKDASGNYILLGSKLPLIHAAVLNACDGLDGLADGLIDDPRRCNFDPSSLICAPGQEQSSCLSAAEAGVVRKLHDGATDPNGQHLEQKISHEWGSELEWTLFVPDAQGKTPFSEIIALSFLRYLAHLNAANPEYQLSDFSFSVPSFWDAVQMSHYIAATDPDLSGFAGHGGKLLLWHGWSDQHISPQSTLEYYDAMRQTMGASTVDGFAKLFLFPGVAHCSGGEGPDSFDILTPVMAWVESGTPPDTIIASKVVDGSVTRTRPVYAYPAVARYSGAGSPDDAASFVAFTPAAEPGPTADYSWVGKQLYSHGYEAWCQASGAQLACDPATLRPLSASLDSGSAGAALEFSGFGFDPQERIAAWFNQPDGTVAALPNEQIFAQADGRVRWIWTIPAGLLAGSYQLVAHGISSGAEDVVQITIR